MTRGQFSENIENVRYSFALVSGQQIVEVSGAAKLHQVTVNRGTSGQICTVFDAAISGRFLSAGVNVVALVYAESNQGLPNTLEYDIELNSGLVIVSSGATWNLTATYK